jgi:hypothetical protein
MRLYGLYKKGILGALACRRGNRSRRYGMLWPRRGKQRLLALFAKVPGYSFNEAGQLQGLDMPGSKPKFLVSCQSALAYVM